VPKRAANDSRDGADLPGSATPRYANLRRITEMVRTLDRPPLRN
jgi:hypothetical protein